MYWFESWASCCSSKLVFKLDLSHHLDLPPAAPPLLLLLLLLLLLSLILEVGLYLLPDIFHSWFLLGSPTVSGDIVGSFLGSFGTQCVACEQVGSS